MDTDLEILSILSELDPTRNLPEDLCRDVARHCRLDPMPARTRLRAADHTSELLFLVDGHAACLTNGVKETLESHQGLNEPVMLFEDPDPKAVAATLTPCVMLRIPRAALDAVRPEAVEVNDIELDATGEALLDELYELIANNRLELPARPEVALRIQELTADPDSGIAELTDAIQRDGTLAGGLLHAVNSPLFRAAEPIQSIREAVTRLGYRNTRMLTTNLALRHAFKTRHEVTGEAMRTVWEDGVLCSAFSHVLADTLGILNRERALLAGLVAGIGAVPIIRFIEMRNPEPESETIESLLSQLQGITGTLVVNYWGLGPDLVAAAEHFEDWTYEPRQPDYASVAIVARWCTLGEHQRPQPPAASVAAFRVLGIAPPPPGEGVAMLADRGAELKSLRELFSV